MKGMKILILLISSVVLVTSCEKSDDHYYDYQKTNITYDGTVYDYLIHQPGVYDSLVLMLERLPALKSKLNDPQNEVTFFAVNNRSFELAIANLNSTRMSAGLSPLYIEDFNLNVLDTLAYRYVFDQNIDIHGIRNYKDGQTFASSKYDYTMHTQYRVLTSSGIVGGGEQQIVFSDVNESIYKRYWQSTNTKSVDLQVTNGIFHTLSSQHDFGFGKLNKYFSTN
ncbi:hypothetical protein FAZ19_21820 [Sphingobacterium alkalisoli]|uniref:FAS1 domain-containing protein n=2 Tax=Sphingobacterium alkalisoli TaxID=1874115 RepID=A0A4U0GUI3_9SPHI|nr:hypothetical protein FAZ19_21820 [Sphingobacterium alkalisoli]